MATRPSIRRRAVGLARHNGRSRGFASRDGSTALASTGGAARTLIDTAGLPPTGAASSMAENWWLYLPTQTAADQRRLIGSYDGSLRTFTHQGGDYSSTTITNLASGIPYLVLEDDPDVWNSAISEALQSLLSYMVETTFTPTTNRTVRYDLSAAPVSQAAIERGTQIMQVDYHSIGETSGQERWRPFSDGRRTWKPVQVAGKVYLDFEDPDRAPTTSDVLRIQWMRQFPALTDETTTVEVDEEWAAFATLMVMAKWLGDPNNAEDDWTQIGASAAIDYDARRRAILGENAFRRVSRTSQQQPGVSVRGRGGR